MCESGIADLLYETGKEKRTCNIFFQIVELMPLYDHFMKVICVLINISHLYDIHYKLNIVVTDKKIFSVMNYIYYNLWHERKDN